MRGGAREGYANEPGFPAIRRSDRVFGAAQGIEDFRSRTHKRPTAGRQFYRSGCPVQQPRIQLIFELLYGPAQGRLRDVEPLRGPAEMQLFRHGKKGDQLVDFHSIPSLSIEFRVSLELAQADGT